MRHCGPVGTVWFVPAAHSTLTLSRGNYTSITREVDSVVQRQIWAHSTAVKVPLLTQWPRRWDQSKGGIVFLPTLPCLGCGNTTASVIWEPDILRKISLPSHAYKRLWIMVRREVAWRGKIQKHTPYFCANSPNGTVSKLFIVIYLAGWDCQCFVPSASPPYFLIMYHSM